VTGSVVAVLAGIVAILAGMGAGLRLLWRISWQMGQHLQRFDDHVTEVHRGLDARLDALSRRGRRG
jgi:hypothetical protein